jgi:hypothetical protein
MLKRIGWVVLICLFIPLSCKQTGTAKEREKVEIGVAKQSSDGSFMLKIADAALVQDELNPGCNTAEWHFNIDRPGSYKVWLSSLTCDTMKLGFDSVVTITAGDSRIEKIPIGDEIVVNDNSVKSPWFRADSEMGTFFFNKAGEFVVQVISEKVKTPPSDLSEAALAEKTLINSVILKPSSN